ncbi:ABC transporter permease, partial [Vibrio cholerae O1]|nr:ABC transporter permease [Vibrio cholerae O1]
SLVLVINVLIAIIALLVGLLLSALAKTEFQFIQFVPVAIVPQFLFSGIINVDTMSEPLRWIAHLMPLYYGVDALQKVIK